MYSAERQIAKGIPLLKVAALLLTVLLEYSY